MAARKRTEWGGWMIPGNGRGKRPSEPKYTVGLTVWWTEGFERKEGVIKAVEKRNGFYFYQIDEKLIEQSKLLKVE